MKKVKIFVISVLILGLISIFGLFEKAKGIERKITVIIKPYEFGKKKKCEGVWEEGMTVIDALKECDKVANLGLKLAFAPKRHKSFFVDEIMGLRYTKETNRLWLYYVNGVFIPAVDPKAQSLLNDPKRTFKGKNSEPFPQLFYLKPNDIVEWRFETWMLFAPQQK